MDKVLVRRITSATFEIDNSNDTERVYDISASVQVGLNGVQAISNITAVYNGAVCASCSVYNGGVNGSFTPTDNKTNADTMSAVEDFVAFAKTVGLREFNSITNK